MVNKSLMFCRLMSVLAVSFYVWPADCRAVDVLRPEDENLLWEVNAQEKNNVRDVLREATYNQEERPSNVEEIIFIEEPLRPMRAPGLNAIRVPDEINAKAEEYDDPDIIKVNPKTPRTVKYLIGKEREAYEASRREWYNPDFSVLNGQNPTFHDEEREARISQYKDDINDCIDSRRDRLDMEMSMLGQGNAYDSAAYLSQTFEAIEQCYDKVGLDIVLNLYGDDDEALDEFGNTVRRFHVNSVNPGVNTKYCGESCSMRSIAEWQLEKFAEYRTYLAELIDKAPEKPKVQARVDEVMTPVEDEIYFDEDEAADDDGTFIYEDEKRGKIRVRQVEAPFVQPVMMYDDEGIPLIDEAEF